MPDSPIIAFSKVKEKGLVNIPLEVREKMGLEPGTKMIVYATDEAVVLRRADAVFEREPTSILGRIRSVFSKLPIKDIEE